VAVAGINITQMLYDLLLIGQATEETGGNIFNVLFDHPKAFEEMYCIAFHVLDTLWDEMNASYMDFPRVIAAVKKQIADVLAANPSSIDQFNRAATWKGPKQQNQVQEEDETTEPEPVKKLRSQLRIDLMEMIRSKKLNALIKGAYFRVYKPKPKQPSFIYFRIQENLQEFVYGSVFQMENSAPSSAELQNILKVSDCTEILIGMNTPMFSKQKKLSPQDEEQCNLSFSIVLKDSSTIDYIACTKDDFLDWTDGFRILISNKLENKETLEDLKGLVNLELRIRLIEISEIPKEAPPVPPLPD